MWLAPTNAIVFMPAARAAFSPDTLSSTTTQRSGATPSVCAACR